MKVLVVDNVHLYKGSDGQFYAPSIYSYDFLKRYLNVFEEVRFVGKVQYDENVDISKLNLVSGPGVEIMEIPWYQGMTQMLQKLPQLIKEYRHFGDGCDCYIFRVAQVESFFAYLFSRKLGAPYAVEVVNDPETFVDLPDAMRMFCVKMLKHMTKHAAGASYVTQFYLQKKYPNSTGKSRDKKFETYYSSVNLEESDIYKTPMNYDPEKPLKIVHVSNAINNDIKGHYTLLRAATEVIRRGCKVQVTCIGDGTKVGEYREYVRSLGMSDYIHFIGRIHKKDELLNTLRQNNLMVLPTQMEGLPRTIIEAMSVGLPCLSTPTAGIPELLDRKYIFDPMDHMGFANSIERLSQKPDELLQMSITNLEMAKQFTKPILEKRRTWFYGKLKECVQKKKA